jgi:NAD(P)-dependent dehydrogenase (short-subunit alcohol dehydrogenase family)
MEAESTLLEGKVAVVSGIGPGLGRRAAVRLAANGADLVLGARRQSSLDEVAAEIEALGRRVLTLPTDITNVEQCKALGAAAVAEFGHVDILVNNAFRFDAFQSFEDVDLDQWEKITGTNVFGTLRMIKAMLPHLKAAGGGSVINVASLVARQPQPVQGGYATSKGGLLTATKVLAFELGAQNIRVNAVVPGWMAGPSVARHHRGGGGGRDHQADPAWPYSVRPGGRRCRGVLGLGPVELDHRSGHRLQWRRVLRLGRALSCQSRGPTRRATATTGRVDRRWHPLERWRVGWR